MANFEELSGWLNAWYEHGRARDADRFSQAFLYPLARGLARRGNLPEDVAQEVALAFLDREKRRGAEAQSIQFWRTKISWLTGEKGRPFRKQREQEQLYDPSLQAHLPPLPELEEETLPDLSVLTPVVRLYLVIYSFDALESCLTEDDYAVLAQRTGQDRATLERLRWLDDRSHEAFLNAYLGCLFPPAAWASPRDRSRCLDTARKGRTRALKLLNTLKSETP